MFGRALVWPGSFCLWCVVDVMLKSRITVYQPKECKLAGVCMCVSKIIQEASVCWGGGGQRESLLVCALINLLQERETDYRIKYCRWTVQHLQCAQPFNTHNTH